jgi:hypothetical protein
MAQQRVVQRTSLRTQAPDTRILLYIIYLIGVLANGLKVRRSATEPMDPAQSIFFQNRVVGHQMTSARPLTLPRGTNGRGLLTPFCR